MTGRDGQGDHVPTTDVLVLGGGSVGLAAATSLARAGFTVQLVERGPAPPAVATLPQGADVDVDARVYAISPRSSAWLRALGAWPAVEAARVAPYTAMQVWQAEPAQALRFAAAPGATLGAIVEHRLLNAALAATLATGVGAEASSGTSEEGSAPASKAAVQARFESVVDAITIEKGSTQATLADGTVLAAKLLVVADGPESPWPARLGLDALGWGYAQRALVCHGRCARGHGGVARQRFLATGPLALLPLADGRVSIVWSCTDVLAAELLGLDDDAFALRLAIASQDVLGPVLAVTPRRSFPLRAKRLATPVAPGAVVIGDAAHVIHPLAGQGVNLGLADAEQLACTLAEARAAGRGWWQLRTLQAYARARAPEVDEVIALTDALHRGFVQGGPRLARLLGVGLRALDRVPGASSWLAKQAVR